MRVSAILRLCALCLFCSIQACSSGGGGDSSSGDSPIATPYEFVLTGAPITTDDSGQATVSFTLPSGVASFQVSIFSDTYLIQTLSVTGPNGSSLFDAKATTGGESRGPGAPHRSLTSFSYPFNPAHSAPAAGSYTAKVQLVGNTFFTRGQELRASVITKRDSDLSSGAVQLNFIFAGLIADSKESKSAVRASLKRIRDIFARAGISLNVSEFDRKELPSILPNPFVGDASYEQLANELPRGVNVVFGVDVLGIGGTDNYFTQVGSIPGSFIPSRSSGIAVGLARLAGRDGEFDSDEDKTDLRYSEIDIMSEAIAHDIGHYLGLYNTVDFLGTIGFATDGLDTPKCFSDENCIRDLGAAENLMFTIYLENLFQGYGEFLSRYRLEPSQAFVLNRSLGVN